MNLQFVILAAACALAHGVWAADAPVDESRDKKNGSSQAK
jgi:hypothetical protein